MNLQDLLKGKRLVLASNSPRRKVLMEGLDVNFETWKPKHSKESFPDSMEVAKVPEYLARQKAAPFRNNLDGDTIVLTSDTIVVLNNTIIGKPVSEANAKQILKQLSGNKHTVITGVALSSLNSEVSFSVKTDVYFRTLTEDEINYYVDKYKPFDKAGAYGVQEWIGYVGVEKIDGSFYNVMGLPVQQVYQELVKFLTN